MKYIKQFNEKNEHIDNICKVHRIKNYTINSDGSIDVEGSVNIQLSDLQKLPLMFNRVAGDFYCSYNELTSLKGAPNYVGGDFYCENNELITLEYCPKYVCGDFNCSNNNIISLEYYPEHVGRDFNIEQCPIVYIYRNYIKYIYNIELFNEYRIIEGDTLYLNRLKDYAKLNNYHKVDIEELDDYEQLNHYIIK